MSPSDSGITCSIERVPEESALQKMHLIVFAERVHDRPEQGHSKPAPLPPLFTTHNVRILNPPVDCRDSTTRLSAIQQLGNPLCCFQLSWNQRILLDDLGGQVRLLHRPSRRQTQGSDRRGRRDPPAGT